jgi:AraC family transcriptional activator of pobA
MMKEKQIEKYHYQKDRPTERQFDMYDLNEYYQNNSEHASRPHTHSFYQIIWFKSKKGKHLIDFKDYQIKENRLFFIAKNQIFNNNEAPFFQIPNELEHQIISYFTQISIESTNTTEFGNKSILSYLLKSLLLMIEREKRKSIKTDPFKVNQNSTFLKFRDLVEKNFNKNWSVHDFANELSISSKTLNTITKSAMDKTVSQVLMDRIILESKRKLTHSNAYVNQIAYDLGFKDPYYFIKYFKKHVKCSPSEFRKSIS